MRKYTEYGRILTIARIYCDLHKERISKMKKRIVSFILILALAASMTCVSYGSSTVRSSQNLIVNEIDQNCDIYNIGGYNYFKLRDLAYLMNGTGSQFSVGYDTETQTVTITTGEGYMPIGGELVVGEDKSATSVKSSQTIRINGKKNSTLSVYNIGGNNYFKLRDLGKAVGFDVDYDEINQAMLVDSVGDIPTKRTTAKDFTINVGPQQEIYCQNMVFNKPVTINGDYGSVVFNNCIFNSDVINTADYGTSVTLAYDCYVSGKCILRNGNSSEIFESGFPEFRTFTTADVVTEDCAGIALVYGYDDIMLNGEIYPLYDMDYYMDYLHGNGAQMDYDDQDSAYHYVAVWIENGELQIYKAAVLDSLG